MPFKKRNIIITQLVIIFLIILLLSPLPFEPSARGSESIIWYNTENVARDSAQALGDIDVDIAEPIPEGAIYVIVKLPDGVTYMNIPETISQATYYVKEAEAIEWAKEDEIKVKCDGNLERIGIRFRENGAQVNVGRTAAKDIEVSIRLEGYNKWHNKKWSLTGKCKVGIIQEESVEITAATSPLVTPGRNCSAAEISISEKKARTLRKGDYIYLKLLDSKAEWEYPNDEWVQNGDSGLQVDFRRSSDGKMLSLQVIGESTNNGDRIIVKPKIWVKNDFQEKEVKVEVTGSVAVVPKATLVIARLDGQKELNIVASAPPFINPGHDRKVSEIKFIESKAGTLKKGDRLFLTILTPDSRWEYPGQSWVVAGNYGLNSSIRWHGGDDRTLEVEIINTSYKADVLTIRPLLWAGEGIESKKIEVEVTTSLNADKIRLVVAYLDNVADRNGDIIVYNDSEEVLYRASSGRLIDTIYIKTGQKLSVGSTILLTLDKDIQWYRLNYPSSNLELIGFEDENRTVRLRIIESTSEIEFKGCQVSIMPDTVLGNVRLKIAGTAGIHGTVKIGEVKSKLTISASRSDLFTGKNNQPAGNIVIRETDYSAWNSGTSVLTLPDGITFASSPVVKINGKDLYFSNPAGTSRLELFINHTSGIDEITINDIRYNIDYNTIVNDVKVNIYGTAFNTLDSALYPIEANKEVGSVINAKIIKDVVPPPSTTPPVQLRKAAFTIGNNFYTINGTAFYMDVKPYIKNGRVYLPVRYVAKSLGIPDYNVLWDGKNKNVILIKDKITVILTIGSKVMKINGVPINIDSAPEIIPPGRTMLPYRWIAQALGASVYWDAVTQTVTMIIKES